MATAVAACRSVKPLRKIQSKLQPLKRNLSSIDTERVYRVVKGLVDKIEEINCLSIILADDTLIFSVTNVVIRDLLLQHQKLLKHCEQGFHNQEFEINFSVKEILRACLQRGFALRSCVSKQPETPLLLELRALCQMVHERLLTEAQDESKRNKYVLQVMEKARHSRQAICSLNQTLKEDENKEKLSKKDRTILDMQTELASLLRRTDEDNNKTLNNAAKEILTGQISLENRLAKLTQEQYDSQSGVSKTQNGNYKNESKLRKRKFKMAGELFNWVQKYDQDMGWRQDEIDELEILNRQDLEEIKQLEEHLVELQQKYDIVIEERRLAKEAALRREKEMRVMATACIKIQAIFRGFLVRNRNKNKGKGKKGKGKKGKGKKGKK